jgi:NTP pyrophosphatase (non-canonical NTP hydrolase)
MDTMLPDPDDRLSKMWDAALEAAANMVETHRGRTIKTLAGLIREAKHEAGATTPPPVEFVDADGREGRLEYDAGDPSVGLFGGYIFRGIIADGIEGEADRLVAALARANDGARLLDALRALPPVEWGSTSYQDDAMHVADLVRTLELTRKRFGLAGPQAMHGVYLDGTPVVLCHTGTSPNSPAHARLIVGLLNHARELLRAYEADKPAKAAEPEASSDALADEFVEPRRAPQGSPDAGPDAMAKAKAADDRLVPRPLAFVRPPEPAGRYVTPHPRPEGLEAELLDVLQEEAGEIVVNVSKAKRFGLLDGYPGTPETNRQKIGEEIGDLNEVVRLLVERGTIDQADIDRGMARKREKLPRFLQSPDGPASPWRDIATAPRNGRLIIVPGGVAFWRAGGVPGIPDEGAWCTITGEAWPGRPIEWPVTVWMPLPDAPTGARTV